MNYFYIFGRSGRSGDFVLQARKSFAADRPFGAINQFLAEYHRACCDGNELMAVPALPPTLEYEVVPSAVKATVHQQPGPFYANAS